MIVALPILALHLPLPHLSFLFCRNILVKRLLLARTLKFCIDSNIDPGERGGGMERCGRSLVIYVEDCSQCQRIVVTCLPARTMLIITMMLYVTYWFHSVSVVVLGVPINFN